MNVREYINKKIEEDEILNKYMELHTDIRESLNLMEICKYDFNKVQYYKDRYEELIAEYEKFMSMELEAL